MQNCPRSDIENNKLKPILCRTLCYYYYIPKMTNAIHSLADYFAIIPSLLINRLKMKDFIVIFRLQFQVIQFFIGTHNIIIHKNTIEKKKQ